MSSMRDAMSRLQFIIDNCVPEAIANKQAELSLSEFQRLKKKIHSDIKSARIALREREDILAVSGTTPQTAEASYKIRIMIKNVKESCARMEEIVKKEEKKAKKDSEKAEAAKHREVFVLTQQHIEEVENLEKRRFNEGFVMDRNDLMAGSTVQQRKGISGMGAGYKGAATGNYGGNYAKDPFTESDLPDIDIEEDFKKMNDRNKLIDQDLQIISEGVTRLKGMATDMGSELDRHNEDLQQVDRAVNKALDHVDNLNIQMKKVVDGV